MIIWDFEVIEMTGDDLYFQSQSSKPYDFLSTNSSLFPRPPPPFTSRNHHAVLVMKDRKEMDRNVIWERTKK